MAVVENSNTPAGQLGAEIWSTTASKKLVWNGSSWRDAMGGAGGGGGTGDVVGPASSLEGRLTTFSGTTGKVIQQATHFDIPDISTPAPPGTGNLRMFARSQAGRQLPAFIGPNGLDSNLQPALFRNSIWMWLPSTGTTVGINFGTAFTARNAGTGAAQAHPTRASTNAMTSMSRATFGTGTTATGSSGIQSANTVAWRGNAAGLGGFFFFARLGIETLATDMRVFVGLSANNAAIAADASTWANTVGLVKDTADLTWHIVTRNASTVTKTPTGITATAGQVLDFMMYSPPNGANVTFRIVDTVTGTVLMDDTTVSTNLPVNTAFMFMHAQCMSVTGTTAKLLALNRMYCESDL